MFRVIIKACIANIRILLGPNGCCRFELPCTDYAAMQLKDQPFYKACWLITKRIMSCSFLIKIFD